MYHIIPVINEKKHEDYIIKIFELLLNENESNLKSMDCLLDHLYTYSYLLKESRIKKDYILPLQHIISKKLSVYELYLTSNNLQNEYKLLIQTLGFIKRNGLIIA